MNKSSKYKLIRLLAAIIILVLGYIFSQDGLLEKGSTIPAGGSLMVHFIDVGQADSILIQQGESSMLIDAGNNGDGKLVVDYISKQGIKKLDYVVGTHPHEDHIGGLDKVIDSYEIGKIYMPKATATTQTFKDVLTSISNKGMKVTSPVLGDSFKLGEAEIKVFAPIGSEYEDANNHSIVLKVIYGDTSFLLTGDAETMVEKEILNKGFDVRADVLKLGHHGSSTSTSQEFLDRVNPKYGVISLEKDNTYNHPHKATMDRVRAKGVTVYRTDESGTIIATSDGKSISFNVKPGSYSYRDAK